MTNLHCLDKYWCNLHTYTRALSFIVKIRYLYVHFLLSLIHSFIADIYILMPSMKPLSTWSPKHGFLTICLARELNFYCQVLFGIYHMIIIMLINLKVCGFMCVS